MSITLLIAIQNIFSSISATKRIVWCQIQATMLTSHIAYSKRSTTCQPFSSSLATSTISYWFSTLQSMSSFTIAVVKHSGQLCQKLLKRHLLRYQDQDVEQLIHIMIRVQYIFCLNVIWCFACKSILLVYPRIGMK